MMKIFCAHWSVWITLASVLLKATVTEGILSAAELNNIGDHLVIKLRVDDNLQYNGQKHKFTLTFTNNGSDVIPPQGWTLYFYSFFMLEHENLPSESGYIVPGQNIRLKHIQGCLFSLEPTGGFPTLSPNTDHSVEFYGQNWAVTRTDVPPNWYVTSGTEKRLLKSTVLGSKFVENFSNFRQWKRYSNDVYNPYTPEDRFNRYGNLSSAEPKRIIPTPLKTTCEENTFIPFNPSTWVIEYERSVEEVAQVISGQFKMRMSEAQDAMNVANHTIYLRGDRSLKEAYELVIDKDHENVVLTAHDHQGVFYGAQSLYSLMNFGKADKLPVCVILDQPRFEYRGMHVDLSRNFHQPRDLRKLMEVMSVFKMNKLHLHLADDEGWRIEIPKFPELTELSSNRCHDLNENECLVPQLGSGPFGNTSGSGYLTLNDYKDLVKYAGERFIEVIPEIESPGHARAAIKAMELRYRKYKNSDKNASEGFLPIEIGDTSKYLSVQMFTDNAINPCLSSTYKFLMVVAHTLSKAHNETGYPMKTFHFGGDEQPPGAWVNSTACQKLLETLPNPTNDTKILKKYFVDNVLKIVDLLGINVAGWEDGWMNGFGQPFPKPDNGSRHLYSYSWDSVWEWGVAKRAYMFANMDYKVILSHATHIFFDQPYEPDPEERGLYWATRFSDTKKAFSYNAEDVYANVDVRRSGEVITKEDVCGEKNKECPPLQKPENIVGMQGQLWSETVLSPTYFYQMIFPRMLALAERAWHRASWENIQNTADQKRAMEEDWASFAKSLGQKELAFLDSLKVTYRIPPPSARRENNTAYVTTQFPGLQVEYKSNGSVWGKVSAGERISIDKDIYLRTVSTDGMRYSRETIITKDVSVHPVDQADVNYISEYLMVNVSVVDNLEDPNAVILEMRLQNVGPREMKPQKWCLYFDNIRLLFPKEYPYTDGLTIAETGLVLYHVGGSLYKLCPNLDIFRGIGSQSVIKFQYIAKYWQTTRTDFMPKYYIVAEGMNAMLIKNTADLSFVSDIFEKKQYKRYPADLYKPFTANERYALNNDIKEFVMTDLQLQTKVIPTPFSLDLKETENDFIKVDSSWAVYADDGFDNEVKLMQEFFNISKATKKVDMNIIYIQKGDVLNSTTNLVPNESYRIVISKQPPNITVTSATNAGVFYAFQTMKHITSMKMNNSKSLPSGEILDGPRFSYRGLHLDLARNFHGRKEIMTLLDVMSVYKLNKLHLHLSDDEGWRLEIDELPELTSFGSKRCYDEYDVSCILSQLGSGPTNLTSGSGFLNKTDYEAILRKALAFHIQIIPEFDMPGHAFAAIKSMEYRYRKYQKLKNFEEAVKYRLIDEKDKSKYLSYQWFFDNAINPCVNSTFAFTELVIKSIKGLHKDTQPLSIYHLGADEVAHGAWVNSTACHSMFQGSEVDTAQLQKHFVQKVSSQINKEQLNIAAWEDGLIKDGEPYHISVFPSTSKVYAYAWDNIAEDGKTDRAYKLANAGYQVVLAHATHLYFDHPYEPDPEERGYYWATRYTDARKVFGYMPTDIFGNAKMGRAGQTLTREDVCKTNNGCSTTLNKPENIIGLQGNLWTETVRTEDDMHSMLFPRLLSLAERAWHKASWEDLDDDQPEKKTKELKNWNIFATILGKKELKKLDEMKIRYRVPCPGGKSLDGKLEVNSVFPGLKVEYSQKIDGPWKVINGFAQIESGSSVYLRTKSADGSRSSRIISIKDIVTATSSQHSNTYSLFLIIFCKIFAIFLFLVKSYLL